MSVCWYCHWGWPKVVRDIYNEFEPECGDSLNFGRSHVVWEDENFSDETIKWCLSLTDERYADDPHDESVKQSLLRLIEIPESVRLCVPDGFDNDDERPWLYPPPAGIEMDKEAPCPP